MINGYIITSNRYNVLLEGYIELYNRHWNDQSILFTILGFDEPNVNLSNNFKFVSLGKQSDYPNWSDPLKKYFSSINDDIFFLSFEDHYLVDKVNNQVLHEGISYMQDQTIDKLYISGNDYSNEIKNHYKGNWFLAKNDPGLTVNGSLMPSIWRRNFFIKLLDNASNGDCHNFERVNNNLNLNCNTLMAKDYVIYPNVDCARKGNFNYNLFETYKKTKTFGGKSWMTITDDIDVFYKMKLKWEQKNV